MATSKNANTSTDPTPELWILDSRYPGSLSELCAVYRGFEKIKYGILGFLATRFAGYLIDGTVVTLYAKPATPEAASPMQLRCIIDISGKANPGKNTEYVRAAYLDALANSSTAKME